MNTSWLESHITPDITPDLLRDIRGSKAVERIMQDLPGWEVELYDDRYPAIGSIERVYTWKVTCPVDGPYGPPVVRVITVPVTTALRHPHTARVALQLLDKLEDGVTTLSRNLIGYGWETYNGVLLPPEMVRERRFAERLAAQGRMQVALQYRPGQVVWRRWAALPLTTDAPQRQAPQTREDRFVEHIEEYARGYHHP